MPRRARLLALLLPYRFGDSRRLLPRDRLDQRQLRAQLRSQALPGRQTPARNLGSVDVVGAPAVGATVVSARPSAAAAQVASPSARAPPAIVASEATPLLTPQ